MICKGKSRSEGGQLAAYLADYLLGNEKNERAELLELSGSQYPDLHRAIRSWEAEAAGSYCRKPLWHAQICPAPGESLTREQKLEAVSILERHLGFQGQARAIVVHQKEGHEHIHVVWSRMDRKTGKALRDNFTHKKNTAAAREIEERFDLRRVENPFANDQTFQTREEKRAASRARSNQADQEQNRRSGFNQSDRKAEITRLWQITDCGKALRLALEEAGYTLAVGDRRSWCIVDSAGEAHSLARQISGVTTKDVNARLSDIDQGSVPGVEAVRDAQREAQREAIKPARSQTGTRPEISTGETLTARAVRQIAPQPDEKPLDAAGILQALTRQHSTFTAAGLSRFLKKYGLTEEMAAQVRIHPDFIVLGSDRQGVSRFTSREMLKTELSMEAAAQDLAGTSGHRVKETIKQAAPRAALLNEGQSQALAHVLGKEDLALVIGYAGTGKSTMLGAAREAWEAQGYRVQGAALSGIAAQSLEEGSGIASRTLHSLFYRMDNAGKRIEAIASLDERLNGLEPGRRKSGLMAERARIRTELDFSTLSERDVLVIDEAGMIGSQMMERLLTTAAKAGAKVVLSGDWEQLQAIDAGGAFRALWERHGGAEITEVKRQQHEWQREATRDLATGSTAKALSCYQTAGCIQETANQEEARAGVITAWNRTRRENPEASQIMLAYTRADVAALNIEARAAFRAEGRLGTDVQLETATGDQSFAKGDRLYFTKNDTRLQVKNGTLGTVEAIQEGRITVAVDTGRTVSFDLAVYNHVTHGYAATIHKSQGVTVDRTQVLASPYMDRHATYVGLSRHRDRAELHYSREESGSFDDLTRALSRDGRKDTTLDYVRRTEEGMPTPERFRRAVNAIWEALRGIIRFPVSNLRARPNPENRNRSAHDRLAEFLGIKPEDTAAEDVAREAERTLSAKLQDLLRRGRGYGPDLSN